MEENTHMTYIYIIYITICVCKHAIPNRQYVYRKTYENVHWAAAAVGLAVSGFVEYIVRPSSWTESSIWCSRAAGSKFFLRWRVRLAKGLVSPCAPSCLPLLDGASAFPEVLSPLLDGASDSRGSCLPLSPFLFPKQRPVLLRGS